MTAARNDTLVDHDMNLAFDINGDWDTASNLEWLETNGMGGYASSTVACSNSRRYHGLLIAATHPPVGRMVMLSKLDERILAGTSAFDLASNQFPGAIHPRGHEHLRTFVRAMFPSFEYAAGRIRLRKTIASIHGENTTVILYEVVAAPGEFVLELRPFIAARDHHHLSVANNAISRDAFFRHGVLEYRAYHHVPPLFIAAPNASFSFGPDWHYRFEYPIERERSLAFHEDLFTPGTLAVALKSGDRFAVVASIDPVDGRDGIELFERELERRKSLALPSRLSGELMETLGRAADQFIVRRGADRRTLIAGYHWFTDWGRDTMIALPGVCLATGRHEDARRILLAFAESVSEGMLPNRFPDSGEGAEYNTVDATLWFFVAGWKYLLGASDETFVHDVLFPLFREVIVWHDRGTRHNIHVDHDGLLAAGTGSDQLTWMDAKCDGHAFTPRHGKPVEINALWYNALSIQEELERRWGTPETADVFRKRAAAVRDRFKSAFWNAQRGCLFDVIGGPDQKPDDSIRPNQIFALSLPFPLLTGEKAEAVLDVVTRDLLTPRGLRSLAPDDPRFVPRYEGNQWQRDKAYHQGTVWSWLLGPFITALVRVRGEKGIARGLEIIRLFEPHLREAGVGTVSEIFDGTPPHQPRGCIAQAWSVGEILRAMIEDLGMGVEGRRS